MSAGDPLASEQDALLRKYYLSRGTRDTTSRWSADGPKSISPFVPCCASRIPTVLRAARLMPDDVLWDLGCGDGRLLHHAAGQYGCRCVGVDIDADDVIAHFRQTGTGHQTDITRSEHSDFHDVLIAQQEPGLALVPRQG